MRTGKNSIVCFSAFITELYAYKDVTIIDERKES
jgi:hypothetical protein